MDATLILLAITILILFVLCIFFIFRSVRIQSTLIDPLNCPQTNAEFGVYSNTLGTAILDTCGINSNEICTFNSVSNLNEAIQLCHANATICKAFSFAPNNTPQENGTFNGTMSIINFSLGTIQSNTFDTYVQQIPVTVV